MKYTHMVIADYSPFRHEREKRYFNSFDDAVRWLQWFVRQHPCGSGNVFLSDQ